MRELEDLEANALLFWPTHISEKAANSSIIPRLIETQEDFISLLQVANKTPFSWKEALALTSNMPANLFLKHLMVLADIGGEKTERICRELKTISGKNLDFVWNGKIFSYPFKTYKIKGATWTNSKLKLNGKSLIHPSPLTPMMEDVANFILFAGASISTTMPDEFLNKCIIGNLIGNKTELEKFVKQRYIWVSRITGGATSNTMGYLAQNYVADYLKNHLKKWDFSLKSIPGISQNENTDISFDFVAHSPKNKFIAIEASFQVTTNSVIERKAGQALARRELLHKYGHRVAYVIDGSGNFTRASAFRTICRYSDCTVTFKDSELNKLIKYLIKFDSE